MGKNAQAAEANKEPAIVEWRGHEFTVEREYERWSVDLLESIEEGKAVGIVRGALGSRQWTVVKSANLNVGELGELADLITAALGFGSAGESEASSN